MLNRTTNKTEIYFLFQYFDKLITFEAVINFIKIFGKVI